MATPETSDTERPPTQADIQALSTAIERAGSRVASAISTMSAIVFLLFLSTCMRPPL